MSNAALAEQEVKAFQETFHTLQRELAQVIVGQQDTVEGLLVAFFAGGHVLLEGVPGLGKTLLVKSFSQTLALDFKRVQCTPDLMPADILGTQLVIDQGGKKEFTFAHGPVFTNILLADEINRATPKTQAALLEAMAEKQVTVAGKTHPLKDPFFVMATQNPIEMEGTYTLPEAQLDRFLFKLNVSFPRKEDLAKILAQTTTTSHYQIQPAFAPGEAVERIAQLRRLVREVLAARQVEQYIVQMIMATQPAGPDVAPAPAPEPTSSGPPVKGKPAAPPKELPGASAKRLADRFVTYGASPRGAQAVMLGAKVYALMDGRVNVSLEDVDRVVVPALNHRVVLNFEAEAEHITSTRILNELRTVIKGSL